MQDLDGMMLSELVALCQHPDLQGIASGQVRALRIAASGCAYCFTHKALAL